MLIECSYGEIVDKWTILKIKLKYAVDPEQVRNIQKEHDSLQDMIINPDDILITGLQDVNQKLWKLEDLIRLKSGQKQFDHEYIQYSESIHQTNDLRYRIKKLINKKYDSNITEEKIYTVTVPLTHINYFDLARHTFKTDPGTSMNMIEKLISTYDKLRIGSIIPLNFGIDLYMAYRTNRSALGLDLDLGSDIDKVNEIIRLLPKLPVQSFDKHMFYMIQIGIILLDQQRYLEFAPYAPYLTHVLGPNNVRPSTVSTFKPGDIGKKMLIYTSGGLGDIIMYLRFIPEFCQCHENNDVILMCHKGLSWMFRDVFKNIQNLEIIDFNERRPYDYHNNICSLFSLLKYTYDNIPWYPYLKNLKDSGLNNTDPDNLSIMIGWKGNKSTNDRDVPLENILNALKGKSLITVQKDITDDERQLLCDHNVVIHTNDLGVNAFYDTVTLLHHVKAVVSNDTALLHLAGSMGVKTIAILIAACEWRWTKNTRSNWYPNMVLVRQKEQGNWSEPLQIEL